MTAVQDILDHKGDTVWTIAPETSVYDALARMDEKGVGALVVIEGDELVGLVTERDYARKVVLRGDSSRAIPVSRIMTSFVITISPERPIQDCMALMTEKRVRHLPVVAGEKLVGLVSIGDVVSAVIRQQEAEIELLHSYIQGG